MESSFNTSTPSPKLQFIRVGLGLLGECGHSPRQAGCPGGGRIGGCQGQELEKLETHLKQFLLCLSAVNNPNWLQLPISSKDYFS